MSHTDRPAAFWLDTPADGPEPWSVAEPAADRDTDPAPPPVSGRYAWTAPERAALPARSAVRPRAERRCRQTDPCVTPPPGSDRGGDLRGRVTILPAAWARPKGDDTTKGG